MDWLRHYLDNLIAGDQRACFTLVQAHIDTYKDNSDLYNGIQSLYYNLFQPSMRQVGILWESNQISVAQEHVATAITQHVMASLYKELFSCQEKVSDKRVIMTCPSGELHELPSRMLADLLVLEGADVIFVGASTPTSAIIQLIEKEVPDALVLSCTISRHIPEVKSLIAQLRASHLKNTYVVVGGHAFDQDPGLYAKIGADSYGATFKESIQLILQEGVSCHIAG